MIYNHELKFEKVYQYTSNTKTGERYKEVERNMIRVGELRCNYINDVSEDLRELILLSNMLNVPVRYNFNSKPQYAYIKIVGLENLKNIL